MVERLDQLLKEGINDRRGYKFIPLLEKSYLLNTSCFYGSMELKLNKYIYIILIYKCGKNIHFIFILKFNS
jgi:hypothetical protein